MSAPVDMLAVKLLRGFQSSFGPSRPDDDEDDAEVWDQIDAACEALAELIEVSRVLLTYRVGEYPTRGDLRDNDASRAQLDALATALARVGGAA